MNVTEVYTLFGALIDETDDTFLTVADRESYLKTGYQEFRDHVNSIDPDIYLKYKLLAVGGVRELDLNGILLGPAAVTQMDRLVRVAAIDSIANNKVSVYLQPTSTTSQLFEGDGDYCLSGDKLVFGVEYSGDIRIEYVETPTVNWALHGPADNEFIDNLNAQHPMIALLAAQYYAIRDNVPNMVLDHQLVRKRRELESWLTVGRHTSAAQFVNSWRV